MTTQNTNRLIANGQVAIRAVDGQPVCPECGGDLFHGFSQSFTSQIELDDRGQLTACTHEECGDYHDHRIFCSECEYYLPLGDFPDSIDW